ncbi:hypothetical protein UPYG_G00131350 [Umbra pygmaea]|uniref:TIR domain-containing protein n=1 Tax=Umbra pygmaea TaxID=75934 RepID=A0ABD0WUM6_UMBPY
MDSTLIWLFFLQHAVIGDISAEVVLQSMHSFCAGRNLSYIPGVHPKTQSLDFSFNHLPSLHQSIFPHLLELLDLDLTRCKIQHIADDAFYNFYLRYCCILMRGYKVPRQQELTYDAFVIYSSKDEAWVIEELVENLEKGVPPIQLCLHVRDFEVGKAITSNIIDEGIMGSRKVIVVVSHHFIESAWCRFEFEVAQSWLVLEGNPNIIIIILEDVEEEKTKKVFGLHKYLKKNTYLEWRDNPVSSIRFWVRLRKAVLSNTQR